MPNADQNYSIDPNVDQFRFRINAMILIAIDRHWALIEGVLIQSFVQISDFHEWALLSMTGT